MLPDSWITKIFDHMSAMYGAKFTNLWKESDAATVKRLWAEKLSGFAGQSKAIKAALEDLDDRPFPPTLPEFLILCRENAIRLRGETLALEYKPTEAERAENDRRAKEFARKAKAAASANSGHDMKKWARDLRADYLAGQSLSAIQQRFASEALGETWANGKCTPKLEAA